MKVQDSGLGDQLSLADTLAKGVFGDPEAQMKAKLLASEVLAKQAYSTKLGADTGLVNVKTREEQAISDAQDAAARAGPAALNAAVPMPVPVEAPRADALGTTGYGPQPGIVSPEAQRMHDAQISTNNALWPLIVRSGANPTQLIEGVGKGEGLSALSGGLVPGSKPDPNVQRVAGGLYTGTAPSTSTVWSPGDTAGQQAEAGKDIAVARGKPVAPEIKNIGPKDTPYLVNPDGSIKIAPGFQPSIKGVGGPYDDLNSEGGVNSKIVNDIVRKAASGQPISAEEAQAYAQAYTGLYGAKTTIQSLPNKDGQMVDTPVTIRPETPPNFPSPSEVYSRAGVTPPPAAPPGQPPVGQPPVASTPPPAAAPSAPPATPEQPAPVPTVPGNISIGAPLGPPKQTPMTTEQQKARTYAVMGRDSNDVLSAMGPGDIPSGLDIELARTGGNPGAINSVLGSLASPNARKYGQAASAFIEAYARPATGATISPADYASFYQAMIPLPGNDATELARKAKLRSDLVNIYVQGGFSNDAERDKFLASRVPTASAAPTAPPSGDKPANAPPEWDNLSPRGRELWLKKNGGQK